MRGVDTLDELRFHAIFSGASPVPACAGEYNHNKFYLERMCRINPAARGSYLIGIPLRDRQEDDHPA